MDGARSLRLDVGLHRLSIRLAFEHNNDQVAQVNAFRKLCDCAERMRLKGGRGVRDAVLDARPLNSAPTSI